MKLLVSLYLQYLNLNDTKVTVLFSSERATTGSYFGMFFIDHDQSACHVLFDRSGERESSDPVSPFSKYIQVDLRTRRSSTHVLGFAPGSHLLADEIKPPVDKLMPSTGSRTMMSVHTGKERQGWRDGEICLRNLTDGRILSSVSMHAEPQFLALDRDGYRAAVVSEVVSDSDGDGVYQRQSFVNIWRIEEPGRSAREND